MTTRKAAGTTSIRCGGTRRTTSAMTSWRPTTARSTARGYRAQGYGGRVAPMSGGSRGVVPPGVTGLALFDLHEVAFGRAGVDLARPADLGGRVLDHLPVVRDPAGQPA